MVACVRVADVRGLGLIWASVASRQCLRVEGRNAWLRSAAIRPLRSLVDQVVDGRKLPIADRSELGRRRGLRSFGLGLWRRWGRVFGPIVARWRHRLVEDETEGDPYDDDDPCRLVWVRAVFQTVHQCPDEENDVRDERKDVEE